MGMRVKLADVAPTLPKLMADYSLLNASDQRVMVVILYHRLRSRYLRSSGLVM
jgi:hypothetical protein